MAMLTVNGAAVPAPSALKVTLFEVNSAVTRNAAGSAVLDRLPVKRRLNLGWASMRRDELAALITAVDGGFFDAVYPDPGDGALRSISCYCSDRSAGVLRMQDGEPVWTNIEMIWTER